MSRKPKDDGYYDLTGDIGTYISTEVDWRKYLDRILANGGKIENLQDVPEQYPFLVVSYCEYNLHGQDKVHVMYNVPVSLLCNNCGHTKSTFLPWPRGINSVYC